MHKYQREKYLENVSIARGRPRGQAANEFFIIIIAVVTVYVFFLMIATGQNRNLVHVSDRIEVFSHVHRIAAAIDYLTIAGDGAGINASFFSRNATATIENGIVTSTINRTAAMWQVQLLTNEINTSQVNSSRAYTQIVNNDGRIGVNQ